MERSISFLQGQLLCVISSRSFAIRKWTSTSHSGSVGSLLLNSDAVVNRDVYAQKPLFQKRKGAWGTYARNVMLLHTSRCEIKDLA